MGTMSEQQPNPVPTEPAGIVGSSSTTILTSVESVRRLVVTGIVLVIILIVAVIGSVLVVRNDIAALNDRLGAQPAAAAAPAAAASAQASPAGITPAVALTGVDVTPKGVDEAGAVLIGDPNATNVVESFIDLQCPFCQKWHNAFGKALEEKALADGSNLLLKVNTLAFLGETDRDLTTPGASARAANAVVCAADNDGAKGASAMMAAIFDAADPSEPKGQFPTEQLTQLATDAGVSAASVACIQDQRFVPFIAAVTKAGFARGVQGTPTIVVNGQELSNPFTDAAIPQLLQ